MAGCTRDNNFRSGSAPLSPSSALSWLKGALCQFPFYLEIENMNATMIILVLCFAAVATGSIEDNEDAFYERLSALNDATLSSGNCSFWTGIYRLQIQSGDDDEDTVDFCETELEEKVRLPRFGI